MVRVCWRCEGGQMTAGQFSGVSQGPKTAGGTGIVDAFSDIGSDGGTPESVKVLLKLLMGASR